MDGNSIVDDGVGAPASIDVLLETIEALSGARSAEDIAAIVRIGARRLSGADGVAVVLRDGDRCHYVDEDSIAPLWKGSRFPMSACISGWAMLTGETAVIPDIYLDDRIPHDAYRPTFVKSLVMTPVRPSDPVAAIGAYWADQREPNLAEINGLKAIARATATAFENVRLIASLEEAVQRREFLIQELDHRVKNTLAAVQAIARQSLRGADNRGDFETAFGRRLQALSRTHEFLSTKSWAPAPLGDLAKLVLEPFAPAGGERIRIGGPDVTLRPEVAVAVAMGLHELATNAAKHGALSRDDGEIDLSWTTPIRGEERRFELVWRESGGPPVTAPARTGAGAALLSRALPASLGGAGVLSFEAAGLRYHLDTPITGKVALA